MLLCELILWDFTAPKSFRLTKLTKHGLTSLLTAVYHPALDTTVWMDISRNQGPISEIISNGWDQVQGFNLHNPAQSKRTTILNNGPGMLLNIPSLVSMQPRHTFGYCRTLHGTLLVI